ncbi:parallel beta-helix repeat protein [Rhodoblastus acidophilus]|nr:right-handed parallel beta-helix repeat-containing protein [Rhodoblastus acidophilus]MCW2273508.1 parallel beta-helix repeat protein [Rhodoblastus acidophilus]
MKRMAMFVALALAVLPGVVVACDAPKDLGGRVFHVDPSRGSPEGDGSFRKPWRSLAEVLDPARGLIASPRLRRQPDGGFATEPAEGGLIRAGDAIELADGDYGDITLIGYANADFITIAAAPGAKPVAHGLFIAGASHWLLRGLTFTAASGESGPAGAIVEAGSPALGPSDHIAFVQNRYFTAATVADWREDDWVNRPKMYGLVTRARCALVRGNEFFHLRNALDIGGDDSLVEDNFFHDFGNDAMDFHASGVTIRRNQVSASRHPPAEKLHPDGAQGWALDGAVHRDILIDGNIIANLNPSEDNYMQGISIFTGRFENVTIQNNVVATNTWHGITLYGVKNAKVLNNTVVATRPGQKDSWILIHDSTDHATRSDALVRNNIATAIVVENADVTLDHNLTALPIRAQKQARIVEGGGNRVAPLAPLFRALSPQTGVLDLHLVAPVAGAADGAPESDAEGRKRSAGADLGAYAR